MIALIFLALSGVGLLLSGVVSVALVTGMIDGGNARRAGLCNTLGALALAGAGVLVVVSGGLP